MLLDSVGAFATGSNATASLIIAGNLSKDFDTLDNTLFFMSQSGAYVSNSLDTFNEDYDVIESAQSESLFQIYREAELYITLFYREFSSGLRSAEQGGRVATTGFRESLNTLLSPTEIVNTVASEWKKRGDQIINRQAILKHVNVSGSSTRLISSGIISVKGVRKASVRDDADGFFGW